MGELQIMGASHLPGGGDTRVMWDPGDPDETAAAKATWDRLVGKKRFLGFRVNKKGEPGTQITEFDPTAGKLVIAPPMAGGR